MTRHGRSVAVALAVGVWLTLAAGATAHALLQSADPAPGSTVATAPAAVTATFGERPDPKLSSLKVLDSGGQPVTAGPTEAVAGKPLELRVALKPLANGVYTVAWLTVSAVDGHLARGSFAFGVGTAPPAVAATSSGGQEATSDNASLPNTAARLLLYAGLFLVVGVAFLAGVIDDTPPPGTFALALVGWLLAAGGTVAVLGFQLADAGVDPVAALGTSFAGPIVYRLVPLLGGGVVLGIARRRLGRPAVLAVGVAGAVAVAADVATSHAAATSSAPLDVAIQLLHVLAAGVWLGGLAALLLLVVRRLEPGPETRRLAGRFARSATAGVAIVAVTGILRAVSEVGTLDALVATTFGLLVVAKSVLLLVLAALGAINHFGNVPASGRVTTGLRRIGTTEVAVGLVVLTLTSTLVNLAPPSEVNAGQPAGPAPPIVVGGNDLGTSVRVRLAVDPGSAGFNTFRLSTVDYDTGQPIDATSVSLRFRLPARPDVGGSRLDLARTGSGTFEANGANLSLDGTWAIDAVVAAGASSVSVPLQVTTRAPVQQVDVNSVPGLPTIYTVHLTNGRTLQVYVDPGKAGPNDVHATFFDAQGAEPPGADRDDVDRSGRHARGRAPAAAAGTGPFRREHHDVGGHVRGVRGRARANRRPARRPRQYRGFEVRIGWT